MPSERKQLNVRVDDETEELIARLLPAVSAAIGLRVSMSDLVRLGMIELRKKFLDGQTAGQEKPARLPEPPTVKIRKGKK